jgi:hypothetical protein
MAPAGTAGRTLASLALALLFVSPANAADRVGYSTRWSIAEPLSAPQPASDGLLRVAQGEIFMAARLLPPGAARLSADLLDKDGKVLVPQGSELFALAAEGSRIFCTVNSRGTGAVMSVLVGGRTFSHTCLIDADDDGGFDGHFTVRGQIKGLPNFSGRVPKSLKPAGAIRYEQLAPQEMQTSYFVGVEYRGDNNLMGNQIFDLVFGTEGNTDALSDRMMIKARDIPRSLEVLGGSFTLIASADDVATIRIDRLFPPQPFGVQKTTSYQYY